MQVISLSSGSKGNSYILKIDQNYYIIDIGISFKTFLSVLNLLSINPKNIKGIFLTHEHTDHTKGLNTLLNNLSQFHEEFLIYSTKGTFEGLKLNNKNLKKLQQNSKIINKFEVLNLKHFKLYTIGKSHDAKEPVNFLFENGKTIGFFTDFGFIDKINYDFIKKTDTIFIEANYCEKMLNEKEFNYYYKNRLISDYGHLSIQDCAKLLITLGKETNLRKKQIILSHISENSNTYLNTYTFIKKELEKNKIKTDIKICFQNEISEWF